jgi:hypothetical protein
MGAKARIPRTCLIPFVMLAVVRSESTTPAAAMDFVFMLTRNDAARSDECLLVQ